MLRPLATVAAILIALVSAGAAASAAEPDLGDLAGSWQGWVWETGPSFFQGSAAVDLVLAADGTWRGTIGKMTASGVARRRGALLIIDGRARSSDGKSQSVYYALTGDTRVRWGQITTAFNGMRDEHAMVTLRRAP